MEDGDGLGLGGERVSDGDREPIVGDGTGNDWAWGSLPSQIGTAFLLTERCLLRSDWPLLWVLPGGETGPPAPPGDVGVGDGGADERE
jgi:hypothetical protein